MRKKIAIAACALLGLCAGFFAAPLASEAILWSTEPDIFSATIVSMIISDAACACDNRSRAESLKSLTDDLTILKKWHLQDPKSHTFPQQIGLTEVRLSRIEHELGHPAEADADMKLGQQGLAALGWQDVSPAHLNALITQLNSEYQPVDKKNASAASH
jgi:hypothetical protein